MTKSIENIPACNELNPLAMNFVLRLYTSEFVNGGMPPAKVSLRGPNFVSSLYRHPYFVYISNKMLMRVCTGLLGFLLVENATRTPKTHVLAQI